MSCFLYPLIPWLLRKPQGDALFLLTATECVRASIFISGSNSIPPIFSSWAYTQFTLIAQHEWTENGCKRNSLLPSESKRRQILGLRKSTLVSTINYSSVSSGRSRLSHVTGDRFEQGTVVLRIKSPQPSLWASHTGTASPRHWHGTTGLNIARCML